MTVIAVRAILLMTLLAPTGLLAANVDLVESEMIERARSGPYGKILVLGITDDAKARRTFENKCVSHLKGRKIDAVPSYRDVPDLVEIEDREMVVATLLDRQVDGVITIRAVPVEGKESDAWAEAWRQMLDDDLTVRRLIESTLPVADSEAPRFGVEVTLWDMGTRSRVWSGRTDAHSMRTLRKSAGDLLGVIINTLALEGLV